MLRNIILFSIFCFAVTISCKKETDTTAPIINLLSPTEGETINTTTDSVAIKATMDDPDFHNFKYIVTNTDNGDTLIRINPRHDHESHIDFYEAYKVTVDTTVNARLVFTAEDHSGNISNKTVNFKLIK